jgi:hypothetical protein
VKIMQKINSQIKSFWKMLKNILMEKHHRKLCEVQICPIYTFGVWMRFLSREARCVYRIRIWLCPILIGVITS